MARFEGYQYAGVRQDRHRRRRQRGETLSGDYWAGHRNDLTLGWERRVVQIFGAVVEEIMHMDDDRVVLQKDDRIGWRFQAAWKAVINREVQPNLMVQAAQSGERDAAPASRNRAVDVAQEEVSDCRSAEEICERVAAFQHQIVDRTVGHRKWRVMHEKVDRPLRGLCKTCTEPRLPRLTVPARMGTRLVGVEKDQTAPRGIKDRLHEALLVDRDPRKPLAENAAVVMVANEETDRHCKLIEFAMQGIVGGSLAAMSEIAGENAQIGIGVMPVDIGNAGRQTLQRILVEEALWGRHEMRVGDLDDFHVARTGRSVPDRSDGARRACSPKPA